MSVPPVGRVLGVSVPPVGHFCPLSVPPVGRSPITQINQLPVNIQIRPAKSMACSRASHRWDIYMQTWPEFVLPKRR